MPQSRGQIGRLTFWNLIFLLLLLPLKPKSNNQLECDWDFDFALGIFSIPSPLLHISLTVKRLHFLPTINKINFFGNIAGNILVCMMDTVSNNWNNTLTYLNFSIVLFHNYYFKPTVVVVRILNLLDKIWIKEIIWLKKFPARKLSFSAGVKHSSTQSVIISLCWLSKVTGA